MTNFFGGIGKSYTNTTVTSAPCHTTDCGHTMNQTTTKVYPPKLSACVWGRPCPLFKYMSPNRLYIRPSCLCVCACVRACVRVCVGVCVGGCVCGCDCVCDLTFLVNIK